MIQIDLFENEPSFKQEAEIASIKKELGNLRRGAFARLNDLERQVIELQQKNNEKEKIHE